MTGGEPADRLFAVRGANSVESNDRSAIASATREMLERLLSANSIEADAIVSCIFTTTEDLDAEFPAVAAREMGLDQVPLLCAREISVPQALGSVVRVLVHYYAPSSHTPEPAYLGAASELRSDLSSGT